MRASTSPSVSLDYIPLARSAAWFVFQDLPYTVLPLFQTWMLGYLEHDKELIFAYALCIPLQALALSCVTESVNTFPGQLRTWKKNNGYHEILKTGLVISMLAIAVTAGFSAVTLQKQSAETQAAILKFLWCFLPGLPAVALFKTLCTFLNSNQAIHNRKQIASTLTLLGVLVEIAVSYFLFPLLGMGAMGLATSVQSFLLFVIGQYYLSQKYPQHFSIRSRTNSDSDEPIPNTLRNRCCIPTSILYFLGGAFPFLLGTAGQASANNMLSVIISYFGTTELDAFQLAGQWAAIGMRAIMSISNVLTFDFASVKNAHPQNIRILKKKVLSLCLSFATLYFSIFLVVPSFTPVLQKLLMKESADTQSIIDRCNVTLPVNAAVLMAFAIRRLLVMYANSMNDQIAASITCVLGGWGITVSTAYLFSLSTDWKSVGSTGAQALGFLLTSAYLWKRTSQKAEALIQEESSTRIQAVMMA